MQPRLLSFLIAFLPAGFLRSGPIPVIDLSAETGRQVVIAQGTEQIYQGHPTTVLLPDGKTIFATWTLGHGGSCGPMKRSDDGGRTWSELLPMPANWAETRNCPSLYRLTDPAGAARLFVFAGQGADGNMAQAHSTDDGRTWTPMRGVGLNGVMPFCTIIPVDAGKRLVGLTNIRRPGETKNKKSNIIAQSESTDGGLTWSAWRIILDLGDLNPCEPAMLRSPDGRQMLCLLRENDRKAPGHFMTSDDEGRTWTKDKPLPPGLWGDRHMPHYSADGRLVACFRDMGPDQNTHGHFVAWVGRYDDIIAGREGQYKIKLLHSNAGSDCGYPGLELLPDGTFVATTYIKYRPGAEKQSVVSTRFTLAETDALAKDAKPAAETSAQAAPEIPAGILMDDDAGEFTGDWVNSTKQRAIVGKGYRHDNNREQGGKSARFTPDILQAGPYEVRLIYVATSNRASNAPVTVISAEGEQKLAVNQRQEVMEDGVPRALGVFTFEAGKKGGVLISNTDANGFVVVDAVQFVPVEIARAERDAKKAAGFVAPRDGAKAKAQSKPAAAPADPALAARAKAEPVQLAKDSKPADVDGRSYDVIVIGGTASGVACAVRAARDGATVLIVQHNRHLGGMMANGLMQWDALYGGHRAPLFTELLGNIDKYYGTVYGVNSRDQLRARFSQEHYPMGWAEPHVAEREFNRLIAAEKRITVLLAHDPVSVEREGALLKSVTLREYGGTKEIKVRGKMFADATYEGDLFALAKVPYRCGREARDEFREPHAGVVFTNIDKGPAPQAAVDGKLNIHPYSSKQGSIDPASPFTADRAVQAYNYRFCVTMDPENRIMLTGPPPGYDREEFLHFDRKSIATNPGPNQKSHMNSPILPGGNHDYPEAAWSEREKNIERHKNFALGLIWFLQNDESVTPAKRAEYRQWGLPKDEFADHDHIPYEMYVREARRIVGRHVYTEQDNSLAPGFGRTPVHFDSVAITDWYMDSHSCTTNSRPGYRYDGKLILTEESRPGQIPYRSMLPQGVDNLLVPVCLSATHVAWGAVRLEPVWMETGEAAGVAAGLSLKFKTTPAQLNPDQLVRELCERRFLVSFFNDVDVGGVETWIPAVEYFGVRGFFPTYDAGANESLDAAAAALWAAAFKGNHGDPDELAARLMKVKGDMTVTAVGFLKMLGKYESGAGRGILENLKIDRNAPVTRGNACRIMYELLGK